jgi:hypothetical protein
MRTKPLSGAGKFSLGLMLVCCLGASVAFGDVRAGAAVQDATCAVQSTNAGGITTWQIKGTASVTGLVPRDAQLHVTVQIQEKRKGGKWVNMFSAVQSTAGANGTADINTGFQDFAPPPKSGDQYRIRVSGYYMTDTPPMQQDITPMDSPALTPLR